MKILFITLEYPPQKGGVASYYFGMVEELKRQGHEVDVVSSGLVSKWMWPRWLRAYGIVRRALKREKFDLLFVGQVLPLGTVAYLLRKHVPYVVFTHGMDVLMAQQSWRKRWLLKKIFGSAKLIVANSEYTKEIVQKAGGRKLTIVKNLPHIEIVYPCPSIVAEVKPEEVKILRRKLGLVGKKVMLTLGRVVERKGHDLVLRALPEILQHVSDVVYVVAGDGPDLGRLQTLVSSPRKRGSRTGFPIPVGNDKIEPGEELQPYVRFVGRIPDEDRAAYFSLCDFFVMPSRQIGPDVEGFGLVFLEAAMFGKPSIGGRSGGIPEAVLDGATGAIVDPADPSAFARVAVQLLRDDVVRRELGQNAKARALHEFRWEKQVAMLLKALSS